MLVQRGRPHRVKDAPHPFLGKQFWFDGGIPVNTGRPGGTGTLRRSRQGVEFQFEGVQSWIPAHAFKEKMHVYGQDCLLSMNDRDRLTAMVGLGEVTFHQRHDKEI